MSSASKRKIVTIAASVLAVVVLGAGYLLVISPKRSKATELDSAIADTQTQLTLAAAGSHSSSATARLQRAQVAELYRLSRAMPDRFDTAGLLLDLNRVAHANRVRLTSIAPSAPDPAAATAGFQSVPVNVEVEGRYGNVAGFLSDLRRLVVVRKGNLRAGGRLFGVDSVQLGPTEDGFPQVKATLGLEAYSFVSQPPAAAVSTTTTTTTPDDSTSDTSVVAAGSGANS